MAKDGAADPDFLFNSIMQNQGTAALILWNLLIPK